MYATKTYCIPLYNCIGNWSHRLLCIFLLFISPRTAKQYIVLPTAVQFVLVGSFRQRRLMLQQFPIAGSFFSVLHAVFLPYISFVRLSTPHRMSLSSLLLTVIALERDPSRTKQSMENNSRTWRIDRDHRQIRETITKKKFLRENLSM